MVHLAAGGRGRGEAVGVDYHGETIESMRAQIEGVRATIERSVDRVQLLDSCRPAAPAMRSMPRCGISKPSAPVCRCGSLAGIARPKSIATCVTIGIRSIAEYEAKARALSGYQWIKVKVSADRPLDAVAAVRRGHPTHAWSWMRSSVERGRDSSGSHRRSHNFASTCSEQPVRESDDDRLAKLELPVPVCADEPANTVDDLPRLIDRYDFVNIKLDKSGGLTAALDFAHAARCADALDGGVHGRWIARRWRPRWSSPSSAKSRIWMARCCRPRTGRMRSSIDVRRDEPALAETLGVSQHRETL